MGFPTMDPFLDNAFNFRGVNDGDCLWGTFYKLGSREERFSSWVGRSSKELGSSVEGGRLERSPDQDQRPCPTPWNHVSMMCLFRRHYQLGCIFSFFWTNNNLIPFPQFF